MNCLERWGATLLLLVFSSSLIAAPREKGEKDPGVRSTFLRHRIDADVARGGEVVIPVDVIALPGQSVELSVLEAPRFGTLIPIWSGHAGRPSLVYRSDSRQRVVRDEFSVRVRAEGRAWSTQRGVVQILDHPAILKAFPESLDFGELASGATKTLSLCLSNVSGKDAVGKMVLPPSWSVEGDPSFVIPEGSSKRFEITFTPERSGDFSGSLEFSPSTASWNNIPLSGRSLPPFVLVEDRYHVAPERSSVPIILKNPAMVPVLISWEPDSELALSGAHEIPSLGSATLTVNTSRAAVPLESSRTFHVSFISGEYRKSVEITVEGREGIVLAKIPEDCRQRQTTVSNSVNLSARLMNESRSPKDVTWSIHGQGRAADGQGSGSLRLQGGECRELSVPWIPEAIGSLSPRLYLGSSDVTGWQVDSRAVRSDPDGPVKPDFPPNPLPPGPSPGPRFPTDQMRKRMVILHPSTFEGNLYPRHLLLAWSYQGNPKTSFVIEEKTAYSGMSDRTGEADEGWKRLSPKYVVNGERGIWAVRIPMFLPGFREFRIYPCVDGDVVMASSSMPLTAELVFGPVANLLVVVAVILLALLLLRMRANRGSSD